MILKVFYNLNSSMTFYMNGTYFYKCYFSLSFKVNLALLMKSYSCHLTRKGTIKSSCVLLLMMSLLLLVFIKCAWGDSPSTAFFSLSFAKSCERPKKQMHCFVHLQFPPNAHWDQLKCSALYLSGQTHSQIFLRSAEHITPLCCFIVRIKVKVLIYCPGIFCFWKQFPITCRIVVLKTFTSLQTLYFFSCSLDDAFFGWNIRYQHQLMLVLMQYGGKLASFIWMKRCQTAGHSSADMV